MPQDNINYRCDRSGLTNSLLTVFAGHERAVERGVSRGVPLTLQRYGSTPDDVAKAVRGHLVECGECDSLYKFVRESGRSLVDNLVDENP